MRCCAVVGSQGRTRRCHGLIGVAPRSRPGGRGNLDGAGWILRWNVPRSRLCPCRIASGRPIEAAFPEVGDVAGLQALLDGRLGVGDRLAGCALCGGSRVCSGRLYARESIN